MSINIYEEIQIPFYLIDKLKGKFYMQQTEFDFIINSILQKEYMLFDRSLYCFIFNECVIFTNFDVIKTFLFEIFDIVIEDKTVINFLINILTSKNFQICFKQSENKFDSIVNNYKIIQYLLNIMNSQIKTREKPWCLKFNVQIKNYKFLVYVCREKDFDILIDPRYY